MKKKLLALISMALIAVLCFAFTACGGGESYSETFTGKLSEETYTSENEAAEAFIENEICGNTTQAVFVSYEKKADVAEEEVATLLGVTEAEAAAIDSVEEGVISYSEAAVSSYSAQSDLNTQRVFMVHYSSGEVKYFVPAMSSGEVLTKSYYESVMNPENYKNFTLSMTVRQETKISVTGYPTYNVPSTFKCTYKINDSAVYVSMEMSGPAELGFAPDQFLSMEMYVLETSNSLVCAVKVGAHWDVRTAEEAGFEFNSIDEIYSGTQVEGEDWTLFVKTENGFALRPERLQDYFDMYLFGDEDFMSLMEQFQGELDMSVKADYFVTEGRISKFTSEVGMYISMSDSEGSVSVSAKANTEGRYSDFGTTTVVVPDEVKHLIG